MRAAAETMHSSPADFSLARVPVLSSTLAAILLVVFFIGQGGGSPSIPALLEHGAKNRDLIVELGQTWRLLTANLLHTNIIHVVTNAVFLFNLGGPAEAIFFRRDYVVLVLVSALGTTVVSTLASAGTSCGASGIVFGLWGAVAVFGWRHRDTLPARYRRYFLGSVIPYSIFALYFGFSISGVDVWGHLGGLLAGMTSALFLRTRYDTTSHYRGYQGVVAVVLVAGAALVLCSRLAPYLYENTLSTTRYTKRFGLHVPIPRRWHLRSPDVSNGDASVAFGNSLGAGLALETRRETLPVDLRQAVSDFIDHDLTLHLDAPDVRHIRVHIPEPKPLLLLGFPSIRVQAEIIMHDEIMLADYYVIARGRLRHIVGVNAPEWLAHAYSKLFQTIVAGIRFEPSAAVLHATRAASGPHTLDTYVQRIEALLDTGDTRSATLALKEAQAEHASAEAQQRLSALSTQIRQMDMQHTVNREETLDASVVETRDLLR